MHLFDLPPELLVLVLKRSLHGHDCYSIALKANLPLLAICSKLRLLSLPLVYRCLIFSYEPVPASGSGASDASPDDARKTKIRTNLGLVVAAGGMRMVREVVVATRFARKPSPALCTIIERMRAAAPVWSWVNSLVVAPAPGDVFGSLREVDIEDDWDEMLAVGDTFAELLPGLRQLNNRGARVHPLIGEMCGRVVVHVAGRLLKVVSESPMYLPSGCQLDAARDVRIWRTPATDWQPPRIPADALEELSMVGWTDDDICSFIDTNSAGSSNHAIVFPKLKAISLMPLKSSGMGRATADVSRYWQRMCFPALKSLYIWCGGAECHLWNSSVLPNHLDSLTLDITGAACESIAQTTLPKAGRLILKVNSASTSTTGTLSAINRILSGASGHEIKGLVVMDDRIHAPPDSIACSDLTMLVLDRPTSVDELLGFLCTQPRLRYVNLRQLTVDDTHADVSIPSSDEDQPAVPLHTSLVRLSIMVVNDHRRQRQAVAVAKRLLLGLPALADFVASGIPKQPLVDFVREYAHCYPHLENISLELSE